MTYVTRNVCIIQTTNNWSPRLYQNYTSINVFVFNTVCWQRLSVYCSHRTKQSLLEVIDHAKIKLNLVKIEIKRWPCFQPVDILLLFVKWKTIKMAAIIAQMTRANRERKKNKCFEIVIGKCMYEIGPFPERYEPEVLFKITILFSC